MKSAQQAIHTFDESLEKRSGKGVFKVAVQRCVKTAHHLRTSNLGGCKCARKRAASNRKASSGRERRVRARCARIQAGEALDPTLPAPPRSSSRAPDSDKALAQAIHRDLHRGSVKKAARRPNAEPVAAINPETLQKLSDLHSDPPRVAPPDDPPPCLLYTSPSPRD